MVGSGLEYVVAEREKIEPPSNMKLPINGGKDRYKAGKWFQITVPRIV